MTKLDKPSRREIAIEKKPYTVTIVPLGLKMAAKGLRRGVHLYWTDLVKGDLALASGMGASTAEAAERGLHS